MREPPLSLSSFKYIHVLQCCRVGEVCGVAGDESTVYRHLNRESTSESFEERERLHRVSFTIFIVIKQESIVVTTVEPVPLLSGAVTQLNLSVSVVQPPSFSCTWWSNTHNLSTSGAILPFADF